MVADPRRPPLPIVSVSRVAFVSPVLQGAMNKLGHTCARVGREQSPAVHKSKVSKLAYMFVQSRWSPGSDSLARRSGSRTVLPEHSRKYGRADVRRGTAVSAAHDIHKDSSSGAFTCLIPSVRVVLRATAHARCAVSISFFMFVCAVLLYAIG